MTDKTKTTPKAAKPMAILNSAQMESAIKSITGRGAKLQSDIHQVAISALDHYTQHGDITLFNKLILAMPKSARTNALIAWALHFGGVALNPDKKTQKTVHLVSQPVELRKFDVTAASATPFWTFKATEGTTPFSFDTYSASLVKSLDGAIAKATDAEHKAKLIAAKVAITGVAVPETKAVEPATV